MPGQHRSDRCHKSEPSSVLWDVNAISTAAPSEMESANMESLDAIFRAHYERVTRAEEIAVEVFLKWWRSPQAHGERAEGWLYRTSAREALDELRRQRVRTMLAALKRRHAEILLLWSEGIGYREIAASPEVNPNYVGSLVVRAQEAFRKEDLKR